MNTKMTLVLTSCPNRNISQTENPAPEQRVPVSSFAEASARSRAYIAQHNLGASNWTGGQILSENDEKIARVSFDGRVWQEPLAYDPPDDPYNTLLDADKLAALKRDYETCHWLSLIADAIGSAPSRSAMIVSLEQVAGELLDEIIVDLGGEMMYLPARQYLDHLTRNEQPLPDFDGLCRWISRQAGLAQPNGKSASICPSRAAGAG